MVRVIGGMNETVLRKELKSWPKSILDMVREKEKYTKRLEEVNADRTTKKVFKGEVKGYT